MPYAYSCERILATVDWAHAALLEHRASSGYAMDDLLKQKPFVEGAPRPGKFARYLRGENTPNESVLRTLASRYASQAVERLLLPLYEVLRRGHAELLDDSSDLDVMFDIERWLDCRLTRHCERMTFETVEPTPARALTLATYANSYALAALLAWAPSRQCADTTEDSPEGSKACLVIGQRAFQCLILAMASGEFPQIGPVLTARIRQRVLDPLAWQDQRLDTASVDVAAAVAVGRRLLTQAYASQRTPSKRRSALRELLCHADPADLDAITPKIVPAAQAEGARRLHRTKLAFGQAPVRKANLVRGYGTEALRQLRIDLGDYVSDE